MWALNKKTWILKEARFKSLVYILYPLNKMIKEGHGSFKSRFFIPLDFHANIQLNFGNSSQIGNRSKNNPGSDSAVNQYGLIKSKILDSVIYKHFSVFNLDDLIPHVRQK